MLKRCLFRFLPFPDDVYKNLSRRQINAFLRVECVLRSGKTSPELNKELFIQCFPLGETDRFENVYLTVRGKYHELCDNWEKFKSDLDNGKLDAVVTLFALYSTVLIKNTNRYSLSFNTLNSF